LIEASPPFPCCERPFCELRKSIDCLRYEDISAR